MKKAIFLLLMMTALSGCESNNNTEKEEITPFVSEQTSQNAVITEEVSYLVSLDKSILSLIKVDGTSKEAVTSIEIDANAYPEEDIERLTNGIESSTLEEGYKILENFTN